MKRGVIELEKYALLRVTGGAPDSWSGGISGPNIVTVSENEADLIIDTNRQNEAKYYVSYHWHDHYNSRCSTFIEKTIPELQKLGDNDNVRIVFFFDN